MATAVDITTWQRHKLLIFRALSGPSNILGWLSCSGNLCANIRAPSFWLRALSWTNSKPCCVCWN